MSAATITARITSVIHAVGIKLEAFAVRVADFTHDLHAAGLQDSFNAVCAEAAELRQALSNLGADTRDATIVAKTVYAAALQAAQDAFEASVKQIQDSHTAQRAAIITKLSDTNTAAANAAQELASHDESRSV